VSRAILRWVGNGMIVAGAVLLLGTVGLIGYAQIEQNLATQEVQEVGPPPTQVPTATAVPTAVPTDTPMPVPTFAIADVGEGRVRAAPTPTATPVPPTPTSTPIPVLPPERVVAPAIGLDTKVVESRIVNGEWQVPKFVAGHLQGTSLPLEGGNVVLSGHVQSISSGNVFAKIGDLHPGDAIRLYTKAAIINYTVSRLEVVPNNDVAVTESTGEERLTLITCTGTWLPLQRDFDRRIVVIAAKDS
jgi:sortase A